LGSELHWLQLSLGPRRRLHFGVLSSARFRRLVDFLDEFVQPAHQALEVLDYSLAFSVTYGHDNRQDGFAENLFSVGSAEELFLVETDLLSLLLLRLQLRKLVRVQVALGPLGAVEITQHHVHGL